MLRNMFGGTKCRTIDKVDIFGDSSGVALYRLDGNANDESGNYHGTETAITYGGGVYERGAVFNGTTSVIANTILPSMGTSNAVSFYINTASTANQGFVEYSNGTNLIAIYHTSTTLAIRVNALLYTVTTTLPKSVFNHIVVSFATNVPTLYLNGTLQTLGSVGATAIAGTTGLRIGVANVATVQTYTNGSIDQLRIFNRAITATEVAILYSECAPTSIVDNANPFEDNSLKAMYQFNGNANDLTGVYNGTATNVTYGTGKFGQCAVFNGTSSKVDISSFPSIGVDSSVSAWVNTATTSAQSIAEWSNGTNLIALYYDSTTFKVRINALLYSVTSTIPKNVFVHVCVTILNNVPRLLVNGIYTTLTNSAVTAIAGTSGLRVGVANIATVQTYMNGSIDQFRIFNKAITPMEVASLYTETTPMEEPLATLVDPFKDGSGKALYRLEGNALDESGNYNGTWTSGETYGNGIIGRCAVFNGTNKFITTGITSTNVDIKATTKTISMWISRAENSLWNTICGNGNGAVTDSSISIAFYNDLLYLAFNGAWCTTTLDISTYIPLNTMVHLVCIHNNNNYQVFVNNVSIANATFAPITPSVTLNFRIGAFEADYGTQALNGLIDQFRFFNRALTQAEVTSLYQAGA